MKKVIALLLAVAMLACLCACGDNSKKDDSKTNNTTQPVGTQSETSTSKTKIYYKTDAAGSTITTVIVLPDDSQGSFPLQTAATGTNTTAPTFTYEDDNHFNDATLAW